MCVCGFVVQSNASACKKIEEGDEIVYVGGHTVVSDVLVIYPINCLQIFSILNIK